jgi:hypothetical protein
MYEGWLEVSLASETADQHTFAYKKLLKFATQLNVKGASIKVAIQNWELLAGIEGDREHDVFVAELELLKEQDGNPLA